MLLMQHAPTNSFLARLRAFAVIAAIATAGTASPSARGLAEESAAYRVELNDVTAKVGEHVVMLARLRIRDGYRILDSYRNRVIKLSAEDGGVAFDRAMVPATVEEGALVFAVGLRATKPGRHPINGIFRVGYIHDPDEMSMVSMRLIASVTGTE